MPDDIKPEDKTTESTVEPSVPPIDPRIDTVLAENQALKTQLQALGDTVTAALTARTAQSTGGQGVVTPQLRQELKRRGYSDADIEQNAPIILPWIEVMVPELVSMVESRSAGLDERLSSRELEDDTEGYPYARALRTERKRLIAEAKKNGQLLSQESAYHTAVSLDLAAGDKSKVREADAARRSGSASTDASATASIGHRTSSGTSRRAEKPSEPRTREDISAMSRDERMKFWDSHGDLPIQ